MKGFLLFLLLVSCLQGFAQKITGTVTDKSTKLPVIGALVSTSVAKSVTNTLGQFEIQASEGRDTLKISQEAYTSYILPVNGSGGNLLIELDAKDILLNTVNISSARNYKQDSLRKREEFAKEFNYRAPRLRDAFGGNSTFSPSAIFAAINRKKSVGYKLQQRLIDDEHQEYIDRTFSPSLISTITGLTGARLTRFRTLYRPDYGFVTSVTTYDMITYIKNCYNSFVLLEQNPPQ